MRVENVGGGISVCTTGRHTFGTDAFLLSDFARPRRRDKTCDLGCGCGIIPLLWYREEGAPVEAWAVDIQPEAVDLARESASRSGLDGRLRAVEADLRDWRSSLPTGAFDLVTCNPPYYAAGSGFPSESDSDLIARHETMCALDDVCAAAEGILKYGGRLCMCHLPERLTDVLVAMRAHRIEPKRLRMVQQRAESTPWLFLVEGRRGGKPGLVVEPPFIMRLEGGPSDEMMRVYRHYGKV